MNISISAVDTLLTLGTLLKRGARVKAGKVAQALRLFAGVLLAALALHAPLALAQGFTITTTHLHNDAFGNIILATDEQGNVLWRERYQPYGAKRINQASKTNPVNLANPQDRTANIIGFHGKEADSATGLSYFGARYYDPVAGRFMGTDAVRFDPANPHSFNRYAYGNGNPYKYKDPDGKMSIPMFATATILGVGGLITYYSKTPAEQKQMIGDLQRLRDRMFNQSGDGENKGTVAGGSSGAGGEKQPVAESGKDSGKVKERDVPNRGEPGEVKEGQRRTREYGPDGRPLRDYDKPHQGHERPHVHEWENGVREHPGRDYSPLPRTGG